MVVLGEQSGRVIELTPNWRSHLHTGREHVAELPQTLTAEGLVQLIRSAMDTWNLSSVTEVAWFLPPDILGVAFRPHNGSISAAALSLPYPSQSVITRQTLQSQEGSTWLWMHESWHQLLSQVTTALHVKQVCHLPRAMFHAWFTRTRWSPIHTTTSQAGPWPLVLEDESYTHIFVHNHCLARSYVTDSQDLHADRHGRLQLELLALQSRQQAHQPPQLWVYPATPLASVCGQQQTPPSLADLYRSWLTGPAPHLRLQRTLFTAVALTMLGTLSLLAWAYWQHTQHTQELSQLRTQLKAILPEANAVRALSQQAQAAATLLKAQHTSSPSGQPILQELGNITHHLPANWAISQMELKPSGSKIQVHAANLSQLPLTIPSHPKSLAEWTRDPEPPTATPAKRYQATYTRPNQEPAKP